MRSHGPWMQKLCLDAPLPTVGDFWSEQKSMSLVLFPPPFLSLEGKFASFFWHVRQCIELIQEDIVLLLVEDGLARAII